MKLILPAMILALSTWLTGCAFSGPFKKTALAREGGFPPDRAVLVVVSATEHRPGMRSEFLKTRKPCLRRWMPSRVCLATECGLRSSEIKRGR